MKLLFVSTVLLSLGFCSAKITAAFDDAKCTLQGKTLAAVTKDVFIEEKEFTNETRTSVLLSWSPSNKENIMLVTTGILGGSAQIYKSDDAGSTFTPITSKFNSGKINIVRSIGLQRNTYKAEHVLLVAEEGHSHFLWISMNNGKDWTKHSPKFKFKETIQFNKNLPLYGLVLSTENTLFGTEDGGATWKQIQMNTEKYAWSTNKADKIGSIYILRRLNSLGILSKWIARKKSIGVIRDLLKINGYGSAAVEIYKNVWMFSAQGKFLFISEQNSDDGTKRHMKVSIDGGKSFEEVQLPSITPDRFYAILDMSEDMIFMHVDNPGDTGHGILYTSGSDGSLYSKSLDHHLYPNFLSITDFYRIQSMRGTYITTKINADNSMHSVISFNRGAEWRTLSKPTNVKCPEGVSGCSLQISSMYSKMNRVNQVKSHLPLSTPQAPGIIMVHGHAHKSLQTSLPDVYVTSDGGHTWYKALNGPHRYQIADNGGLLVAVGDKYQNILKFSTDEGRCWHHYQFTDLDFQLTGILTEPKNKIMKVLVWGFGKAHQKWRVYTVDFSKVVKRSCNKDDYESWIPHSEMSHKAGTAWKGCLLGVREKFMRLKKDSWCSNGRTYDAEKKIISCPCTIDDYECEYGFSRPINSQTCEKDNNIAELDACIKGNLKQIVTKGYRLLPGDKCDHKTGYTPDLTKQVALNKRCGKDQKGIDLSSVKRIDSQKKNSKTLAVKHSAHVRLVDKSKIIWIVCGICLVLIACVLLGVLFARYRQMRERDVSLKFSLLTDAHDNDFTATLDADLLDAGQQSIKRSDVNGQRPNVVEGKTNPVLRSYHDDSDVDILE